MVADSEMEQRALGMRIPPGLTASLVIPKRKGLGTREEERGRKEGSKQKRMTVWDLCKWAWLEEEGENLLIKENSVGKVLLEICLQMYSWASWNKIASGRKAISSIHLITYMLPYRLKSIKVHHYLGNITTSSREKTQHFHNYLLSYHYVS